MSDLDVPPSLLRESLDELLEAALLRIRHGGHYRCRTGNSATRGQRALDVGAPVLDGAPDLLQQHGFTQHQFFHGGSLDLQHGDFVDCVGPGQHGLPGQRGLPDERAFLKGADGDQRAWVGAGREPGRGHG